MDTKKRGAVDAPRSDRISKSLGMCPAIRLPMLLRQL